MSRSKINQLGGVNVVIHPHSPAQYVRLWQKIYKLERAVKVRGDTYAMIGTMHPNDRNDPNAGFHGSIFKFTKIDKHSDWIDLRSAKRAPAEVVKEEIRLPDYLQPNLRTFQYYFDTRKHRLVVETKNHQGTFSPYSLETMVAQFLAMKPIATTFPGAEVTVEQSREVLKTILKRGGLKHLRIMVKKPNPDDAADDERKVLRELSDQNAARTLTELHAEYDKTLTPDERTKLLAKVASSNGFVEGTILDENGKPYPVSSREHAHREPYQVDRNRGHRASFLSAATNFITNLLA